MEKQETLRKAKELIRSLDDAFVMATVSADGTPHVRYMGAVVLEENPFTLYLASYRHSHKVDDMQTNNHVQLLMSRDNYDEVLIIDGTAWLEESVEKKREIFGQLKAASDYFKGPDDPNYALIGIKVSQVDLCEHERIGHPNVVEIS